MREIEALAAVFIPKLFCKERWLTVRLRLPFEKVTEEGEKEGTDFQLHSETAEAQIASKTNRRDGPDFGTNCFQHLLGPLGVFACFPQSGC